MAYIIESVSDRLKLYHSYTESVTESTYAPHYHDKCEIIYFISGDVTYTTEGRTYKLKKGDIVLSRPRQIHRILPKDGTEYERYVAIIDQARVSGDIWKRLDNGQDVFPARDNERIFELYSKLDYYYKHFSAEEFDHLAFSAIEEVLYNLTLASPYEVSFDGNPLVRAAIDYINDNLTTLRGVEDICSELYITKSHLHHLFSEYLQVTPAKYIVTKRLIMAQRLIRRGQRPTEVYSLCGFLDYATFFRNYKRHFGYPPNREGKARRDDKIFV